MFLLFCQTFQINFVFVITTCTIAIFTNIKTRTHGNWLSNKKGSKTSATIANYAVIANFRLKSSLREIVSFSAEFLMPLRVKSEKIIDGQITDISRTPYQLRLSLLRLPICGAALVSSHIALTAAHCVGFRIIPFLYSIQAGGNTISDPRGQKIRVRRIVVNPRYPGRTGVSNDLAILFLWRNVVFKYVIHITIKDVLIQITDCSNRVRPIGIATRMYTAGTNAVISGWGTTEDGVSSIMLRSAPVQLISNQECAAGFRPINVSNIVDASMICTTAERRGTCYVSIRTFLTKIAYW